MAGTSYPAQGWWITIAVGNKIRFFSRKKKKKKHQDPALSSLIHSLPTTSPSSFMASVLRLFLLSPTPTPLYRRSRQKVSATTIFNCSSNPNPTPQFDNGAAPKPTFDIEKRRKSLISPEDRRGSAALEKREPPNFEIGWKRTKEIKTERPKGWQIADFIEKLEELMGKQYGSSELLAKVGSIVAERAREEAELLVEREGVEERLVTELYRVLRLIEMDLEMVKAAVKPETLEERIEQARARCRQAILVALSF